MTTDELADALSAGGSASIPYTDPFSPDRPLVLECYRPRTHAAANPVVLVQHGMRRNGDDYRDAWIPAADRHGLLIVAVTFPATSWPGSRLYNDGHVRDEAGQVRPRETWSQAIPGRIFQRLRAAGLTTRVQACLWGHSAGGQFVHRLLATQPHEPFEAVRAANSGWYSMPTLDRPYPEGLGAIGLTGDDLARLLAYPLVVFAGDQDVETASENLPQGPAAMAQGPHRFARAHHYLAAGRDAAAKLGVACNWRLVVAPGIGHDGARMSAFAAATWFD